MQQSDAQGTPSPAGDDRRFRDLVDRLPQAVFEIDLEGRLTFVNQTGLEGFGYSADDVARGLDVTDMIVPHQRERAATNIGRRMAGGPAEFLEYTALRRDGSTFPALVHAVPISRGGRVAGLQGYLVDISEQKNAEQALRHRVEFEQLIMGLSTRLIGLSHEELDVGVEGALSAVGRFMGVDRSYVFLFSADGALMDNTHEWVAAGITPERERLQHLPVDTAFPWFIRELRERLVVPVPAVADLPPEAAAERAEFQREGILSLVTVAMVQGDRIIGFLGLDAVRAARTWSEDEVALLRIVGELFTGALLRRSADSALRESEKRYQAELLRAEKLRSVGVLAGGIAHDFNNILTAILGNVSLLRETPLPEVLPAELLAETEKAVFRARDLTRQLLTFSRGGEPVRRLLSPAALIRESATLALRGRSSACRFEIAPDLLWVDGDEGQLGQVVSNLVINASQAMAGGGTVDIRAANCEVESGDGQALPEGCYVAIAIADRGGGIAEEHLPRIFDPYFTTKQEGSGLGLAVSYSIVSSHGGIIDVASSPRSGSVFTVYLPAVEAGPSVEAADAAVPVRGRGRVLVMDDEKMVRDIAGKIITALGYEVAFAREGRETVALWRSARERNEPFDVVIMDLTVPGGMGGRDAIRELLAIDPEAKAVVSSGYSQDSMMARHREHGFRDVLLKPYSSAELSRVLARTIAPR